MRTRIKGHEKVAELSTKHEMHPTQIAMWKREAVEKLDKVFDEKGVVRDQNRNAELTKLHAKNGPPVIQFFAVAKLAMILESCRRVGPPATI